MESLPIWTMSFIVSLYKNLSPLLSVKVFVFIVFAVIVPVAVIFLKPEISELLSTTTALLAETLPAVTSSIVSNSFSEMFALPIMKDEFEVMSPVLVILPEFMVPSPLTFPFVANVYVPLENVPVMSRLPLIVTSLLEKSPAINGVPELLLI